MLMLALISDPDARVITGLLAVFGVIVTRLNWKAYKFNKETNHNTKSNGGSSPYDRLLHKLDRIDSRSENTDQRLERMEDRQLRQDRRLDRVEGVVEKMRS